jgi:hypothetical protein
MRFGDPSPWKCPNAAADLLVFDLLELTVAQFEQLGFVVEINDDRSGHDRSRY